MGPLDFLNESVKRRANFGRARRGKKEFLNHYSSKTRDEIVLEFRGIIVIVVVGKIYLFSPPQALEEL